MEFNFLPTQNRCSLVFSHLRSTTPCLQPLPFSCHPLLLWTRHGGRGGNTNGRCTFKDFTCEHVMLTSDFFPRFGGKNGWGFKKRRTHHDTLIIFDGFHFNDKSFLDTSLGPYLSIFLLEMAISFRCWVSTMKQMDPENTVSWQMPSVLRFQKNQCYVGGIKLMNGNRAFPYQAIEKIPRKLVLVLAVALKPDQLLPVFGGCMVAAAHGTPNSCHKRHIACINQVIEIHASFDHWFARLTQTQL